jgi:glycosyltransferase involved in cell wall biosynthesis
MSTDSPFGSLAAGRQLLVDLSELIRTDARSGIQRATRGVLGALQAAPPAGMRVVPVYDAGGFYAHAPDADAEGRFAPAPAGTETPIAVRAGDIFLGLDLAPEQVPRNAALLASLRRHGVRLYFVVYDLLPALHPEWFFAGAQPWFERWLGHAAELADGLVCNAQATVDQLADWLEQHPPRRTVPLRLGHARLGADLQATQPPSATGLQAQDRALLEIVQARPTLLMVGTLEPRKMHAQVLEAFDLLWQRGVDINLAIVGKVGWNVEPLVARLRAHPRLGTTLQWAERAGDELLVALYRDATALLAASAGEGFGLPLIEAAQHGLPVIARDLPVFREVAGAHAWYFDAANAGELADALQHWLDLHAQGMAPASTGMPFLTWADSARELVHCIETGLPREAPYLLCR